MGHLNAERLSSQLGMVVLALFPAVVMTKAIGKGYVSVTLVLLFLVAAVNFRKYLFLERAEQKLILLSTGIFIYTVLGGYFLQAAEHSRYVASIESQLSLLIPAFVLISFRSGWFRTDMRMFGLVVASAALIAGICGFYDLSTGIEDRYERLHGSPIIYGDLAMLFGLISFLLWRYELKDKQLKALYFLAFVLGFFASLYSGSRGGWIGLPMVIWLFWKWDIFDRTLLWRMTLTVGAVVLALALTDNPVKERVLLAVQDIERYSGGDGNNSLGTRFVMWKVAWDGFTASPLFGQGLGEFFAYKMQYVQNAQVGEYAARYKSTHNEYLNLLFSFGLVGTALYTLLFVWLWKFYAVAIQTASTALYGRIGQLTIVAYLDFSLSEVMVSSKTGGAVFMLICALMVAFSVHYKRTATQ